MTTRNTLINGNKVTLTMPDDPLADMDLALAEILLELAVERRSLKLEFTEEEIEDVKRRLIRKGFNIDGCRIS